MKLIPSEPDIRTLVERIDRGDIDLQPDFQRQEVWATKKKKRLIDTVLRGWSIPPVHLVEIAGNRAEVLDGQQRLAALRDFIHNKFSIDGRITPADSAVQSLHGKFYRNLDDATRRQVEQYPLRCFRITDYRPEEPSELFYRLNQPTILTAGEQRNALYGPARQQLKSLVQVFEDQGNDRDTLGFSNVRLAYDDILARILYFVEAGSFGVKSTESRISERFRTSESFQPHVVERVSKAIGHFSELREAAQAYRFNKASVFSWLLFLSRFPEDQPPNPNFLQRFIDASQGELTSHFVQDAAAVFIDRASLRVTDVSSVVFRDFSLNYIYFFLEQGPLPQNLEPRIFQYIEETLEERDDVSFEYALEISLDVNAWSATL
jgi:hypothetical protein